MRYRVIKRPCSICRAEIALHRLTRAVYEGENEMGGIDLYMYVCPADLSDLPTYIYLNGFRCDLILRAP